MTIMNLMWRHETSSERVPPLPVSLGQACYKCYAEESLPEVSLSTCGNCRRVAYCSEACQAGDWRTHMPVCRALARLESSPNTFLCDLISASSLVLSSSSSSGSGLHSPLTQKELIKRIVQMEIEEFEEYLLDEGRALGAQERELFFREPRCSICGISDRLLRKRRCFGHITPHPVSSKPRSPSAHPISTTATTFSPPEKHERQNYSLQPCTHCNTSFFCSPEHLALSHTSHHHHSSSSSSSSSLQHQSGGSPSSPSRRQDHRDQHDEQKYQSLGLTHCHLNQRLRESIRLRSVLLKLRKSSPWADVKNLGINPNGSIVWFPSRIMESWKGLKDRTWEEEYLEEVRQAFRMIPPTKALPDPSHALLRAVSEELSVPLSILWGLEVLHADDLSWTKRDTLRIHILKVSESELRMNNVFEEILHRLPKVRHLEVTTFGPEITNIMLGGPNDLVELRMPLCPQCTNRGRQRTHIHCSTYYDDFVKAKGQDFIKPDIAAAFDASSDVKPWKATIKTLTKWKVPAIFTSLTHEQSVKDAKDLRKTGTKLKKELSPRINPWGSMQLRTDSNSIGIDGFFTANGWIAGGSY